MSKFYKEHKIDTSLEQKKEFDRILQKSEYDITFTIGNTAKKIHNLQKIHATDHHGQLYNDEDFLYAIKIVDEKDLKPFKFPDCQGYPGFREYNENEKNYGEEVSILYKVPDEKVIICQPVDMIVYKIGMSVIFIPVAFVEEPKIQDHLSIKLCDIKV
jgi:hypothetical protein